MKINPDMNFVVPLYHGDDIYAYVHARPISAAAFEMNYRLLIRTYNTMLGEGPVAARMGHLFLKDAAAALAPDGDGSAISALLLNEIGRMSSVILATKTGWQTIPLQQALDSKLLDPEDAVEAANASLFFIVVWHVSPKQMRDGLLKTAIELWGAVRSPLQPTEWIVSLPTSTVTAPSGETVAKSGATILVRGTAPT
jgi:hypothetical protein